MKKRGGGRAFFYKRNTYLKKKERAEDLITNREVTVSKAKDESGVDYMAGDHRGSMDQS